MNILICDDSSNFRLYLRKILEKMGHTVIGEAENGERSLDLYRLLKPQVVMLDIVMEDGDGIEVLKKIIQQDPKANVVICTASGQKIYADEARRIGAKEVILKQIFQREAMQEEIERAFAKLG